VAQRLEELLRQQEDQPPQQEQHLEQDDPSAEEPIPKHTSVRTTSLGPLAVCDGSVVGGQGTFGWVISTPSGERLCHGCGPAFGYSISSYCAEAYGMLSVLLYLHHVMFHFQGHHIRCIDLYCDNSGLVSTVTGILERKRPEFVNDTMKPEWDLIQAIVQEVRSIGMVKVQHVKGHQDTDSDNPNEPLPLEALLNIEADQHATQFQHHTTHGGHSKVPMVAGTLAQLHFSPHPALSFPRVLPPVGEGVPSSHTHSHSPPARPASQQTITRNVRHTLRELFGTNRIFDTIKSKEGWDDATLHLVDWEAHGLAVSNSRETRTFITKLLHDLLPTGARVFKYKQYYDPACPSCGASREDRIHLFQCQATQREQWRTQFRRSLRDKCVKIGTCPTLTSLLLAGVQSVFDDTQLVVEHAGVGIQELAQEQDRLGWHQIFLGRFSRKWRILQSDYLRESVQELKFSNHGTTWVSQLIHTIWRECRQLWDIRNEDRHGKDEESRMASRYDHARRVTGWLYEFRDYCLEDHRPIIFHPTLQ